MSNCQQRHDKAVDDLVRRLEQSGRYSHIDTFTEYYDGDHCVGEVDVLALTHNHNLHIYEVKGSNNYKSRKHAVEQLKRAYNNMGLVVKPKLIYHSPQKTKRIYVE